MITPSQSLATDALLSEEQIEEMRCRLMFYAYNADTNQRMVESLCDMALQSLRTRPDAEPFGYVDSKGLEDAVEYDPPLPHDAKNWIALYEGPMPKWVIDGTTPPEKCSLPIDPRPTAPYAERDAGRYRWLRGYTADFTELVTKALCAEEMDAWVDAAMQAPAAAVGGETSATPVKSSALSFRDDAGTAP